MEDAKRQRVADLLRAQVLQTGPWTRPGTSATTVPGLYNIEEVPAINYVWQQDSAPGHKAKTTQEQPGGLLAGVLLAALIARLLAVGLRNVGLCGEQGLHDSTPQRRVPEGLR